MTGSGSDRALAWLVGLVALHSALVGALLLTAPAWAAAFAGWRVEVQPTFFVRQAGVFHFVVVFAYLWEWLRYRGVGVLVTTKSLAFLFLMGFSLAALGQATPIPWSIPVSGVLDGLMGLVVLWVRATGALRSAHPSG